jgi:DNA-binding transcriptional MerR regulator
MDRVHHLPRMSVGDASRLYELTPRALRYYEERGLIRAGRDRSNARYYDATARARLNCIATLRRAGIGLSDIDTVLDELVGGDGISLVIEKLSARKAELVIAMDRVEAALRRFEKVESPSLLRAERPS